MVLITCPQCNYARDIPLERIPSRTRWVRCPRCGSRFEFVRREGDGEEKKSLSTPWERRIQLGLWQGVKQTIKGVLFSPRTVFSTMPVRGGWREPLAFGLLVGSIGSMFTFFWEFFVASMGFLKPLWGASTTIGSPLVFLAFIFLAPLFVTFNLFISSAIIHVLLLVVRGGKNGYEATFRVVSYSQATRVWSVIPLLGGAVGWIWRSIVYIIGLKEAQETSYGRVILAFSIPFAVLIVVISGFFIFIMHFITI
ncbi:MAG: zinc-ribbon domain-containing protein [Deltaproteobacteria bacterium]|nr:zinc-ribbon domain-containing protein [Deltaproteobacteria bacterium]